MVGFSGRLVVDGGSELSEDLLRTAIKFADTVRTTKQKLGLSTTIRATTFPDGTSCVVADLAGIQIMRISPPSFGRTTYTYFGDRIKEYRTTNVVDLVNGKVDSPSLVSESVSLRASDGKATTEEVEVIREFTSCSYAEDRYLDGERRFRLAIPPHETFRPAEPPLIPQSQYRYVRASQYSGAMRRAIQVLLGIGKVISPNWAERWALENEKAPLSQKEITYDEFYRVIEETFSRDEVRSSYGLDTLSNELRSTQVSYDYRFAKTHGITFSSDGYPWLIQISSLGVHAIPFYMDPVSLTPAGRKRYLEVSPELEDFFDEFKGFPAFLDFPAGEELEKYINAGEALELVSEEDMAEFYDKGAFSSDVGWSFNEAGSVAYNCAVGYREPGFSTGNLYKLDLKIDAEPDLPELEGANAVLAGYAREEYEVRKCRRMEERDAERLVREFERDPEAGRQAFDDFAVEPPTFATGSLTLEREGILYHPAIPKAQPQIKFPETLVNGLISFDFGPYTSEARASGLGDKCDAPMFACHIDDSLHIVNYFRDARPRTHRPSTSTRRPCQYEGRWTVETEASPPYVAGNFYSNVWDTREKIVSGGSKSVYDGKKRTVYNFVTTEYFFSNCFSESTYIEFAVNYTSESYSSRTLENAVAIPFHTRDCYAVYTEDVTYGVTKTTGQYGETLLSASRRRTWYVYNFVWHWSGGSCTRFPQKRPAGQSVCVAIVVDEKDITQPSGGSSNVEPSCGYYDDVEGLYYHACPPTKYPGDPMPVVDAPWGNGVIGSIWYGPYFDVPSSSRTSQEENEIAYEALLFISGAPGGVIELKKDTIKGPGVSSFDVPVSFWWFNFSPDPDSLATPFMGVTQNCLGQVVINYHEDIDGSTTGNYGPQENMYGSVYTTYTGVVE